VEPAALFDILHDLPSSALHVHCMGDEGVEAPTDGKQACPRQLVEGPTVGNEASLRCGDPVCSLGELLLVVSLLAVEIRELPIEIRKCKDGVDSRRRHARSRTARRQREGHDYRGGQDQPASLHTVTSLRRLVRAETAPSSAPRTIMAPTTGQGRKLGSRPTMLARSESNRPRTTKKSRPRRRMAPIAPSAPLHTPLDDERLLHEGVGSSDELENFDFGPATLQHETHRRPNDGQHGRKDD
jgi:hypothetical protein